ncbi:MAG: sugar transferase [Candidatus Helarchaeota archaeon]
MSNLAPIVFFCYNRPDKTKYNLEKLAKNTLANQSKLFIFSDGPKSKDDIRNVEETRNVIRSIKGFKKIQIIERKINFGLALSIITGVSKVINNYGKVIVVEDDITTSKYFLEFMNECLEFYKDDQKVFSITGFTEPRLIVPKSYKNDVFLMPYRFYSWGWGTWKDRWNKIDFEVKDYDTFINNSKEIKEFSRGGRDLVINLKLQMDGKLNSWACRASYGEFKNRGYTLISLKNHIINIGADGSGTHGSAIGYPLQTINDENYVKPILIKSSEILKNNQIMVEKNNEAINKILDEDFKIIPVWKKVLKRVMNKLHIKTFWK